MVGLVIARAQHTAKIRVKMWYFTRYLALKACNKLTTVCPQTERLSVPVIYFHITPWFEREPAWYAKDFHLFFLFFYCAFFTSKKIPTKTFIAWKLFKPFFNYYSLFLLLFSIRLWLFGWVLDWSWLSLLSTDVSSCTSFLPARSRLNNALASFRPLANLDDGRYTCWLCY
jgi:hypothetical protein